MLQKKSFLCVLLIICIFFLSILLTHNSFADINSNNVELNDSSDVSQFFLENCNLANEAYAKLLYHYYLSHENKYVPEYGTYQVDGIYANGFPDYYCGAYINKNGDLVILLNSNYSKEDTLEAINEISRVINGTEVIYGKANSSYKSIVSTMSEILSIAKDLNEANILISEFYIDDYENCIKISITPYNTDTISQVLSLLHNSIVVKIVECNEIPSLCSLNLNCADSVNTTVKGFSTGFRAVYENINNIPIYGFITCGHVFYQQPTATAVMHQGEWIGALVSDKYSFNNNGSIDAAFVYIGDTMSNSIVTQYSGTYAIHTSNISSPSVGTPIYNYGASTHTYYGYIRSGTIASTSSTYLASPTSIYLTDSIKTNTIALSGDSGSPLFLQSNYSGAHSVCGILS